MTTPQAEAILQNPKFGDESCIQALYHLQLAMEIRDSWGGIMPPPLRSAFRAAETEDLHQFWPEERESA